VKEAVGRHSPLFADYGQHDATEFLITILDAIHEDLNQSPIAMGADIDTESWSGMKLHRLCTDSIVCDCFHGESQTILRFTCGDTQLVNEALASWALPLPEVAGSVRLEDCIELLDEATRNA
jgi:ubiquitin C-terminal hydrolase